MSDFNHPEWHTPPSRPLKSQPRIGELFAGYGGLGMGVQSVFGGDIAWYSEIDKGALKILEHRFPGVPNVGDVTTADWSQVEPVDILTGGSPCQDLSHAGKRAGMTEGTRSNLWVAMREAIAQLRPPIVVWENVRGAYSAAADSEVESCAGCVGDVSLRTEPVLRALGRVLGDLSDLGYDARWHGIRAADVGAPHGRFRVFVVATDARHHESSRRLDAAEGACRAGWVARPLASPLGNALLPTPSCSDSNGAGAHGDGGLDLRTAVSLMPTPLATDGTKGGPNQRGSSGDLMLPSAVARITHCYCEPGYRCLEHARPKGLLPTPTSRDFKNAGDPAKTAGRMADRGQPLTEIAVNVLALLPTPAVNDMGAAYTPDTWDEWCAAQQAKHGNGNGHGKSLAIEAQRLLPTPRVKNNENLQSEGYGGEDGNFHGPLHNPERWGDYAAAIARWEHILGREAPAPTMTSSKGNPQLSSAFVEWMMGLPAGWVTDVPGITRNEALKALGNGVVPQQCAEALRVMLSWQAVA